MDHVSIPLLENLKEIVKNNPEAEKILGKTIKLLEEKARKEKEKRV